MQIPLLVPDRDVTVEATRAAVTAAPERATWQGAVRSKERILFRPDAPRGLLLFLHGTGGSADACTGSEALAVAHRAVRDGWAVLCPEAEESVAGDFDGDGKTRWDVAIGPDNVDLVDLAALIAEVRAELGLGADAPNAALGMSNGGAMALALGTVRALDPDAAWPTLTFDGVVVHCASGRASHAALTRTPTLFLGCENDDNPR